MRNARAHSRWLLLAGLAAIVSGCASTNTNRTEPTPLEDFYEYRQIVVEAMSQVEAAMQALDEVEVEAIRNPRKAYAAFAEAVHRLEVDSIRVRARTEAMRARGEAYFEYWEKYLSGVKDERVRKLAEEHRAELKRSFEQGQEAAEQVRGCFRPFLSDLQKLRAVLEAEPNLARIDAQKSLILAAGDKARQIKQGLDRLLAEMNSWVALLTPAGPAPRR
jgi:hypothetical protein